MRKITKESAKAFVNFKSYKKDNTEVSFGWTPKRNDETNYTFKEKETACLFLHGNNIAEITRLSDSKETISINLDLCGYDTRITRERINGVLDALGYDFRIASRNYEQVLIKGRDILKLSDDSFDPDFAKRVFNSKEFVSGTDLNAITDF